MCGAPHCLQAIVGLGAGGCLGFLGRGGFSDCFRLRSRSRCLRRRSGWSCFHCLEVRRTRSALHSVVQVVAVGPLGVNSLPHIVHVLGL